MSKWEKNSLIKPKHAFTSQLVYRSSREIVLPNLEVGILTMCLSLIGQTNEIIFIGAAISQIEHFLYLNSDCAVCGLFTLSTGFKDLGQGHLLHVEVDNVIMSAWSRSTRRAIV
jgi:hypothetical protein